MNLGSQYGICKLGAIGLDMQVMYGIKKGAPIKVRLYKLAGVITRLSELRLHKICLMISSGR